MSLFDKQSTQHLTIRNQFLIQEILSEFNGNQQQIATLSLFEYQKNAKFFLAKGIKEGHRRQLLCSSTGSGKSEITIDMADKGSLKNVRVGIVSDRRLLVIQLSKRCDKYGVSHAIKMSNYNGWDADNGIQICSIQTLESSGFFKSQNQPFDVLYIDEAHRSAMRKSVTEFMDKFPNMIVIGLTASPFVKGLGKYFTNVVCPITHDELVQIGRLTPLRVFHAPENAFLDRSKIKRNADGEFNTEASDAAVKTILCNVIPTWVEKTHEIFGCPVKTIVFCPDVATGQRFEKEFNDLGYAAICLSYKDTPEFTENVINEFKKPHGETKITILIATQKLNEGFDQDDVLIMVDANPVSKSFSTQVQKNGRGIRSYIGTFFGKEFKKEFCLLIDCCGNWLHFYDQWTDLYYNGVDKLDDDFEKKIKEKPVEQQKKEAKEMVCVKCRYVFENKSLTTCPCCGHSRSKKSEVVELGHDVVEFKEKPKKEKHDIPKARFYAELLGYAKQKGYNTGWAYHKTREKYGTALQSTKGVEPIPPSAEVLKWIRSQQIKSAKSRGL